MDLNIDFININIDNRKTHFSNKNKKYINLTFIFEYRPNYNLPLRN